ncbi:Ctr copper transporter [Sporodiniella umbellata]|nr:Ctr copper transporter [Sporodiniella umbellata]
MSGGNDMSGMGSMMDMGTFHWATSGDGLWINTWIPQSEGAYIGACFGILIMTILSRGLPALETYMAAWRAIQSEKIQSNQLNTVDTKQDIEKSPTPALYPSSPQSPIVPPFSWKSDTLRSLLSAFSAFISYLLMMVVMTGNGGFFFVIVGGVFIGEMAFGRYKALGGITNEHGH